MQLKARGRRGSLPAAIFVLILGSAQIRGHDAHALSMALPTSGAPAPLAGSQVQFELVGSGFTQPTAIADAGDGSGRLFIVERAGYIYILKGGVKQTPAFLDVHALIATGSSEQGLLGLAFHPGYPNNGFFYTTYTDLNGTLVLSRWSRSSTNPNRADPSSQLVILSIPHPNYTNHNGGNLAFGADGYLYWGTGDGGGAGDVANNAQNLNVLLGKILRLDVDHTDAGLNYSIPADNPFRNVSGKRGEIWAYGLRNPWRFSFDRLTHNLYIGDVGQNRREEIDFQPSTNGGGRNYGWHVMEGSLCYDPPSGCDTSSKVLPVAEYDHTVGCSVTGGYMYRGAKYELLRGHYFYADFCTGKLFDLYHITTLGWVHQLLVDTPYTISAFGEDTQGGLYLADYGGGKIYRLQYKMVYHVIDFNGDGKTDVSFYRPTTSAWRILRQFSTTFGQVGDIPVPADYNGDRKTDVATFRPSTGEWSIRNQFTKVHGATGDIPVPADYDGDGKADLAFFRPSTGLWSVLGQYNTIFGGPGDIPVPGDYNNDGRAEPAFFRPSDGTWHIKGAGIFAFGQGGDIPIPGDYNGDGKTDAAIFRPSAGLWSVRGQFSVSYGKSGDIPVPGDYNGDGKWDVAVFRPSTGAWFVKGQFSTIFGMKGDFPLPARDTNGDGDPYQ